MSDYAVDAIDFDIEDPTAITSQHPDDNGGTIVSFFQDLHTQLGTAGKKMTLTSCLAIEEWPEGALKSLFYDQNNNPIFTTLFDGLNMMAYGGNNQYYIDADDDSWGIEQWLDIIGPQNAGMMNIGFDDAVAYESASANAGTYQYTIAPGSTRGQAAAQIYIQLQQQLVKDGYPASLGQPFFWPDQSVEPNGESRYGTNGNKSNFVSPCMQDFYNTLHPTRSRRLGSGMATYKYEAYSDNWSGQVPPLPTGVTEDYAFAVVNNDGTFDNAQYPINPPAGRTGMSLAIGGWNNSMSNNPPWGPNGFYTMVKGIDPSQPLSSNQTVQNFLQSMGEALKANPQSWTSVTLDFENYDHTLNAAQYTLLVLGVQQYLKQNFPGIALRMCISPNHENRDYYNIQQLSQAGVVFQAMFYDYALGQPGQLMAQPNAPVYGPAGKETISGDLQYLVQTDGIPQAQILVGVPAYGVTYNCQPGLNSQQFQTAINTWSLPANSYASSNGQITNDAILGLIGDWTTPNAAWNQFLDQYNNAYYYNASSGQVIAANTPATFASNLVPLIQKSYSSVQGVFEWEAVGNTVGPNIIQGIMDQLNAAASREMPRARG